MFELCRISLVSHNIGCDAMHADKEIADTIPISGHTVCMPEMHLDHSFVLDVYPDIDFKATAVSMTPYIT